MSENADKASAELSDEREQPAADSLTDAEYERLPIADQFERMHASHDCDPGPCLCACDCKSGTWIGCRAVFGPYCTRCHMNMLRGGDDGTCDVAATPEREAETSA